MEFMDKPQSIDSIGKTKIFSVNIRGILTKEKPHGRHHEENRIYPVQC